MGESLGNRRKRLDNLLQNRGEDTKRNLKHVKDRAAPAGQFGDEDQVDFGPKARAALRMSTFARTRSPSRASAIPRSARAGASPRKATQFSAPRGSPAPNVRAAVLINESI